MATTFVDYTGDGNATKSFSFPSIKEADVKVTVDEVLKSSGTHYNITSYTTTGGGNVVFTSGNIPASPASIRIFRDTDVDTAKATFVAGSSVKANDLNNNQTQLLYAVQEEQNIVSSTTTVKGYISAADKTKLDGIETAATADQTAAEIRTLVESATDSNVFTDADHTKLNAIEAGATGDQTNAEIRAAVEAASDSNVFTDADHSKLNAIEAGATGDQTNAEIKTAYEANSNTNAFTDAEKTKLSGIEASATGTQSNAEIKTAYEANSDTNAYTDAEKTKLSGIETSADVTDATNVDAAGAIMNSDLDGKGEILIGDGSGDPTALSVGTNGYILTADSTEATGVKWAANAGGGGSAITIQDEGSSLSTAAETINFVGSGVTASGTGTTKTITISGGGGGSLSNVVEDTTPQLGGNLDVQASEINTSTTNGNIKLTPNGTGFLEIKGNTNPGTLQLNCENNSHGVKIKGPAHSAAASYTLTLPDTDGSANEFLKTDGSGNLSWGDTTSTGDFKYLFLCPAGGTGAPTLDGSIATYDLRESSNSGSAASVTSAAQLLVSINGVIQKANTGTSAPSEGFALVDSNTIIFGANLASGDSVFIVQFGSALSIGTPSDNTVTSAKIVDGAIVNADVNASAAIAGTKISPAFGSQNLSTSGTAATGALTVTGNIAVSGTVDGIDIATDVAANTAKTSNATHTGEVTGATALTIADNVVDEANLKVSNSPTNGYFLSAQSGNTGGLTWAEVSAGVTSDGQRNTVAGTGAGASFSGTDANDNSLFGQNAGNNITTGDENTAIGLFALEDTTTGSTNVAVGDSALRRNTTASNNSAVGKAALSLNTTGTDNTAVGALALDANTTGGYNTAAGVHSLGKNTTGGSNVAIGHAALTDNTTGSSNVMIGVNAGDANTTASNNTGVGKDALGGVTTGAANTALGAQALQSNTASNNVGIGYLAGYQITSGTGNTTVGTYSLDACTTGGNNTAVGTGALGANTTASNNTAVGKDALKANTTGYSNTAVGSAAGEDLTTAHGITLIGQGAGKDITEGDNNTLMGYVAGSNITTGEWNTCMGTSAGDGITIKSKNTAIGGRALFNNEQQFNTAIGYDAAAANTTGYITAVGKDAAKSHTTGDQNTCLGNSSMHSLTTGSYNTAVGQNALYAQTTASNNTAVGTGAGSGITTAVQNTCIGHNAGTSVTVYSNNIAIGYNAEPATNAGNSVTLGNSSISSLRCNTTSISSLSDVRDKTEIVSIPVGLDFINTLRPVKFKWQRRTPDENDGKIRAGFIAQELQEAQKDNKFLNLVLEDDPNKLEATPANLIPVLVKAIQELSAKVTALEAK